MGRYKTIAAMVCIVGTLLGQFAGMAMAQTCAGGGPCPRQEQPAQAPHVFMFSLVPELARYNVAAVEVRDMHALNGNLFFLVRYVDGAGHSNFLVAHTDLSGRAQVVVPLGAVEVVDWSVGDDMSIMADLESTGGGVRELRRYDRTGRNLSVSTIPVNEYAAAIVGPDSKLRITRYGAIVRETGGHRVSVATVRLKHLNLFETTCLTLPRDRVAIVDQVDATVTFIDLKTALSKTTALTLPDVEKARRGAAKDAHALSVLAATADSAGHIYCMLTGFRASEGAPVVVLDEREHESLFRLTIAGYPSGPMVPTAIGVSNGVLIVTDQSGNVAEYAIPAQA